MSLGDRIEEWIENLSVRVNFVDAVNDYIDRIKFDLNVASQIIDQHGNKYLPVVLIAMIPSFFTSLVPGGVPSVIVGYQAKIRTSQPSLEDMLNEVRKISTSDEVDTVISTLGALVTEPLLDFLLDGIFEPDANPMDGVRKFYGILASFSLYGSGVSLAGELGSLGFVKQLGKPIESLYWMYGFGFLGWQLLTPYLDIAVSQRMQQRINRDFRPKKFGEGDMLELFRRGEITSDTFIEFMRDEGYGEENIRHAVNLASNRLSESRIIEFLEFNYITYEEALTELAANGHKRANAIRIIEAERAKNITSTRNVSISLVRSAYEKHIINEQEFREMLSEARYSQETINLELRVLALKKEVERKELSLTQVKQAYRNNIITENELRIELDRLEYETRDIDIIVRTFNEELKPRVLRINQGTILKAMRNGVLSVDAARQKLIDNGVEAQDAEIIIQTEVLSGGTQNQLPSVSLLMTALQTGQITRDDFVNRLIDRKYTQIDANLIADVSIEQSKIKEDENSIIEAFRYGVITEEIAYQKLSDINVVESQIELLIDTAKVQLATERSPVKDRQIGLWFYHGYLERETAIRRLIELGYSSEDANLFLDTINLGQPRSASSNDTLSAFEYGIITEDQTIIKLQATGLSRNDAQQLLDTRKAEIANTFIKATPTVLIKAYRDGLITKQELEGKLLENGVPQNELFLYTNLANNITTSSELKLTKSEILRGFKQGMLTQIETIGFLEQKGYPIEQAAYLLALQLKSPEDTLIDRMYDNGIINANQAIEGFLLLDYSDEDITQWLIENDVQL